MNAGTGRSRLDQRRAPIHEALETFRQMRVVPFDVPGHKRGRGNPELTAFLGQQCVGVDVNSMKPLDNLCHPVSVIREAEELAADAFGKELCNGNSIFDFDTTKLSVHTLDIGLAGIEVYDILRDEYDIQIEFGDIGNILAYLSIGDRPQEVERLVSALAEIKRRYHTDGAGLLSQEYIDPEVAASPQEAFYAPPKKPAPARNGGGGAAQVPRFAHHPL